MGRHLNAITYGYRNAVSFEFSAIFSSKGYVTSGIAKLQRNAIRFFRNPAASLLVFLLLIILDSAELTSASKTASGDSQI